VKSPAHIHINLGAYRLAQSRQKQNSTAAKPNMAQDSSSFKRLLSDRIDNLETTGHYPDNTVLLGRSQAQKRIEMIQVRLNDSLLRTLSEFGEDDALEGFRLDWTPIDEIERQLKLYASKFQQVAPETQTGRSQDKIEMIIAHASKTYDVDPDLIRAVIRAESDFDVNSTSPKGAMGLMQLMPETARDLGVKDSYDPVENIMAGTRYLKNLLARYDGNINLALAAYNWGMGNLERHPQRLPRETQTYIARVNNFLQLEKS